MSDNYLSRKVTSEDAELLAYIQTESWKVAFKDILEDKFFKKTLEKLEHG